MLTLTDLFCGGGGSSYGASLIPGVTVRIAANHWPLAVEVHNENHPHADHDCADLSQVDPRRYPHTDMLWASPSCTKHSVAQGKARAALTGDIDAERSRATMWDVQRFAEYHRYRFLFVENVVEVRLWAGFRGWWLALEDTGYCLHEVFLNAAFAGRLGQPAAQWRDRWFCLAHPKGTRCPDIARWTSPDAWCPCCESVQSTFQAWKNPAKQAGKYRTQYWYRCRVCKAVTEPLTRPASEIIDWSIEAERIGDRAKPLADKTMARIHHGLDRYGTALVPVEGRDGKQPFPVSRPMRTCTARNETGLLVAPFIAELRGGGSKTRPVSEPLATVCASGNHHGLVVPQQRPAIEDCTFRMLTPREYAAAMAFPGTYLWRDDSISKRHRVKLAGNAVPPNMARDLVGCAVESM
ncbi:DNA cytosine methyltransferase [Streptomyces sp. NPDC101150]|uniref:DNA cytosine methyltransferase n=1 Tax=Streptomyces sp. NPDC101150 TaxID=3366114 RepID=UPI00381B69CF